MLQLLFKTGTVVSRLDTSLLHGLLLLCSIFKQFTGREEWTVTSVNDGKHKSGSLHYDGRAIDLRCNDLPDEQIAAIVAEFKRFYDTEFDLVWESNGQPWEHLHLEYDPGNKNSGG